jgi:amino acid transporter
MDNGETREVRPEPVSARKKYGTFDGVFLPNILTILGVILYLRQAKVMGEAGLIFGLAIIGIAHLVTIVTSLSLSAVATNMRVKAGGAYYIISRSLGIEWGGCIGIPLAVSQILSIALYVLGFAEALKMAAGVETLKILAPLNDYPMYTIGLGTLAVMTILSFKGSSLVIKTQYLIFLVVVGSLAAIFVGSRVNAAGPTKLSPETIHLVGLFQDLSFWEAFALFFPAVTGITAGVSLSGDLKDPRKSIPRGTLGAVMVGLAVYVALGMFLCVMASPEALTSDHTILLKIAWRPEPVIAGVLAATLSSGLGMILGAPRTIQALAVDGVLPRVLGRLSGKNEEPRVALILSLAAAATAIVLGKLDVVAPILSMFFLATYGMLNLVAGLESLIQNPSYRPTLWVPWWLSFLGAGCSFYVMFLINTPATGIALAVIAFVFLILKRRNLKVTWGDLRRGIWMALIRRAMLHLERMEDHPKNWRPITMVMSGIPQGRPDLVDLANWVGSSKGIVTLRHIIVGPFSKLKNRYTIAKNNAKRFVEEKALLAVTAVDLVEDRGPGLRTLISSQGFGALQANTVLIDWSERSEPEPDEFAKLCTSILAARKTLLVFRADSDRKFGRKRRIDVWVENDIARRQILILIAYLISRSDDWRGAEIHFHVMTERTDHAIIQEEVARAGGEWRIPMTVHLHDDIAPRCFLEDADPIRQLSLETDLLIAPFPYDGDDSDELTIVLKALAGQISKLPTVLFVRGEGIVDLRE